jgi:glycosyltransferase involved in cell wall biosynthesis
MEAMLAGAPVICSRVTSLPETIGDLQFTFDSTDMLDTARAIKLASIDRDYRTHSMQNGRIQMVRQSNSVVSTVDAFHEMYARVIATSNQN